MDAALSCQRKEMIQPVCSALLLLLLLPKKRLPNSNSVSGKEACFHWKLCCSWAGKEESPSHWSVLRVQLHAQLPSSVTWSIVAALGSDSLFTVLIGCCFEGIFSLSSKLSFPLGTSDVVMETNLIGCMTSLVPREKKYLIWKRKITPKPTTNQDWKGALNEKSGTLEVWGRYFRFQKIPRQATNFRQQTFCLALVYRHIPLLQMWLGLEPVAWKSRTLFPIINPVIFSDVANVDPFLLSSALELSIGAWLCILFSIKMTAIHKQQPF